MNHPKDCHTKAKLIWLTVLLLSSVASCCQGSQVSTSGIADGEIVQQSDEIGKRVRSELTELYQNERQPDFENAIAQLGDEGKSASASRYLIRLLDLSLKDERDKKAAIRQTPYWGMIKVNTARALRAKIARRLAESENQNDHVKIWEWFLFQDDLAGVKEFAIEPCLKADPEFVCPIIKRIVNGNHPNYFLLSECLADKNAVDSDLNLTQVAKFCQHHVGPVRQAARQLLQNMGGKKQPDFDPVAAMKSKPVVKIMQDLAKLFGEHFESDLQSLVRIESGGGDEGEEIRLGGLLVAESKQNFSINNFYGRKRIFDKPSKRDGVNRTGFRTTKLPPEKLVEQISMLRSSGAGIELSEQGKGSGQFEGPSAGIFEFALAHWLYRHNKIELASKVFLPAVETLSKDSEVAERIKQRLGVNIGYEMLIEFVGQRDYKKTERLANEIVNSFPRSPFKTTAKNLLMELPERQNDFKTFVLPTTKEWKQIKHKQSRQEFIDYLCVRLRILNCYQQSQPGSVAWDSAQFLEQQGLGYFAAWGEWREGTKAINPFAELMNEVRPADVPFIAPHLRENWFCLSVGFWRDFHRSRQLQSTRQLVVKVINKAGGETLIDERSFGEWQDEDLEREVKKLIDWKPKRSR